MRREVFRPLAQQFYAWSGQVAHEKYNDEVDFGNAVGTNLEGPTGVVDAVDLLRQIRDGHPTRAVRARAGQLASDIEAAYFDPPMGPEEEPPPSFDQATEWSRRAEEIIGAGQAPGSGVAPACSF